MPRLTNRPRQRVQVVLAVIFFSLSIPTVIAKIFRFIYVKIPVRFLRKNGGKPVLNIETSRHVIPRHATSRHVTSDIMPRQDVVQKKNRCESPKHIQHAPVSASLTVWFLSNWQSCGAYDECRQNDVLCVFRPR